MIDEASNFDEAEQAVLKWMKSAQDVLYISEPRSSLVRGNKSRLSKDEWLVTIISGMELNHTINDGIITVARIRLRDSRYEVEHARVSTIKNNEIEKAFEDDGIFLFIQPSLGLQSDVLKALTQDVWLAVTGIVRKDAKIVEVSYNNLPLQRIYPINNIFFILFNNLDPIEDQNLTFTVADEKEQPIGQKKVHLELSYRLGPPFKTYGQISIHEYKRYSGRKEIGLNIYCIVLNTPARNFWVTRIKKEQINLPDILLHLKAWIEKNRFQIDSSLLLEIERSIQELENNEQEMEK
jgi:hypothetical protein